MEKPNASQCFVLNFRTERCWCFTGHKKKGKNCRLRSSGLRQDGEIISQVYQSTPRHREWGGIPTAVPEPPWLLLPSPLIHELIFLIKLNGLCCHKTIRASQELLFHPAGHCQFCSSPAHRNSSGMSLLLWVPRNKSRMCCEINHLKVIIAET